MSLELKFKAAVSAIAKPRVLETGAFRSIPERSTLHKTWIPNADVFLGTDFQPGVDVDVVADIHSLSCAIRDPFDVLVSCSTLEHVKYPHLAAHEMLKVLKVGGLLFVQTHQTFPLHAYPFDYYRFSCEALASLFSNAMGVEAETEYQYPAQIHSVQNKNSDKFPAFLNVVLFGRKVRETPEKFQYEL
jgi:hypothetical protein